MQVILREDIASLGRSGEVVSVRDGYGRNYLLPRGMAVQATTRNVRRLEHERRLISQRERKKSEKAESIRSRIEAVSVTIAKQTGEGDRLFGSVTAREIAEAFAARGIELDRKAMELSEPIRALGMHEVPVRLTRDIRAAAKVWVVSASEETS